MKQNLFVMLCLLSSTKAIRYPSPVSIGEKLAQTKPDNFVQTEDWGGNILGLVDTDEYTKEVKTSLDEQELNITYDNQNAPETNPALEGMIKKKELKVVKKE